MKIERKNSFGAKKKKKKIPRKVSNKNTAKGKKLLKQKHA